MVDIMSNKTIKEFSEELNITKQALHYRVKQLPSKNRQKNSQKIIVLTDEEQSIIKDLMGVDRQSVKENSQMDSQTVKEVKTDISINKDTKYNKKDNEYSLIMEAKQEQIDLLKELLKTKDERIDNLLNKVDTTNRLLDQQQRLTMSLQTKIDYLTVNETNDDNDAKKERWWNRIFK